MAKHAVKKKIINKNMSVKKRQTRLAILTL